MLEELKHNNENINDRVWWSKKRFSYNLALIISGISAFVLYAFLGLTLIAPHTNNFELTIFTIGFQAIGYLFMILIANIFYSICSIVAEQLNTQNDHKIRKRYFKIGYWFSFVLPFIIPALIIIEYFVFYY